MKKEMLATRRIEKKDLNIFKVTNSADDVVKIIKKFYRK